MNDLVNMYYSLLHKNMKLKFSILQISYWCSVAAFTTIAVAFFSKKGLSATHIGFILASYTMGAFIGQLFWGNLCDKYNTNKKMFVIGNILNYIIYVIVFFGAKNIPFIIFAYGLLGAVQNPLMSNLDTWILKIYRNAPEEYGPIRAWGSIGYAIFIIIYAPIVEKMGYHIILYVAFAFIFVSVAVAVMSADVPKITVKYLQKAQKGKINQLLNNKPFIILLLLLFIIGMANTSAIQLTPLLFENIGAPLRYIGIAGFASAIIQVPFMVYNKKLSRYSVEKRMGLVLVIYFLSMLCMTIGTVPYRIILGSMLGGIGFGILLPTYRQAVIDITDERTHTTSQGISEVFFSCLAGITTNVLGGFIMDAINIFVFMALCSLIQVVGMCLLILWTKRRRILN